MSEIPKSYIDQAVKPRGNTVNERLNFLLNWYVNTGTKVSEDSNWDFQIETNKIMAQFGTMLRPVLLKDTDEDTRNAIINFLPIAEYMRINSRSAPANSFFTYLSVELNKVVGA
jgi:hypothetical protein